MELVSSNETNDLRSFIDFLFGGLNGVAYVASKDPENALDWHQHYFEYPNEIQQMESVIQLASAEREVYVAPALYTQKDYRRENFKVSNVVWTEFDGNAPDEASYNNPPSLRISSSGPGHEHCYWRLSNPITDVDQIEEINRTITYALSADSSAWDATQILRPPGTHNHKRNASVVMAAHIETSYDLSIFESLPKAPPQIDSDSWQPSTLPDITSTILKYAFPPQAVLLFQKKKSELPDRSTALMQLAHFGCEMGMRNDEIFAILLNADERWEKFAKRKDQKKRLAHIITKARFAHPESQVEEEAHHFIFNFVDLINTEIEIDWVIKNQFNNDGMLMENGTMMMVGPPGIGKSQLSFQLAIHSSLGKDILHYTFPKPRKNLILSLEMGHGEVKKVLETMAQGLSGAELDLLRENLIIIPHGESWHLNDIVGQDFLRKTLEIIQPEGLWIDSIGSAMRGSPSNDEKVLELMDFNDRIRKEYGLFTWYIHHMRKASNGGNTPTSQDDVYGSQYLVARATSSYAVLRAKGADARIKSLKNRFAEQESDYLINRTPSLNFEKVNGAIDQALKEISYKPGELDINKNDTTFGEGNFDV